MKVRRTINGSEYEFEGTVEEIQQAISGLISPAPQPAPQPDFHYQADLSLEWNDRLQMPLPVDTPQPTTLPPIQPELRAEAWAAFKAFCKTWIEGFEVPGAPQPDRERLMKGLGYGRIPVPILVMAYELGSLQELVYRALKEQGIEVSDIDWLDRVAGTMVQISREGFPDIAGTIDYTQRWRRKLASEFTHES